MTSPIREVTRPHELLKTASGSRLELPVAASQWRVAIAKEAYRTIPVLQDLGVEVNLDKVNEARGYGKGSIIAKSASLNPAEGKDIKVVLPVTISDRKLDPLDVLIYKGVSHPVSNEKLASIFENLGVGAPDQQWKQRPSKTSTSGGLGDLVTPPNSFRNSGPAYSGFGGSSFKLAAESMLKVAATTATVEDRKAFASAAAGLQGHNPGPLFTESLRVVVGSPRPTPELLKEAVENLRPVDLVEYRARRDGAFDRIEAARDPYYEHVDTLTRTEVVQQLARLPDGQEKLAHLESEGYLRFVDARPARDPDDTDVTLRGTCIAKVASGSGSIPGIVFSRPVNPWTQEREQGDLVVTKDGYGYTLEPEKVAGERVDDFAGVPHPKGLRPNTFGVLVWGEGGEYVSSLPMGVLQKFAQEGVESYQVVCEGATHMLYPAAVQRLTKTASGVLYPKTAAFIEVPSKKVSLRSPGTVALSKRASESNLRVEDLGGGDIRLHGPAAGGLAGDLLSGGKAQRALALLGVEPRGLLRKTAGVRAANLVVDEQLVTLSEVGGELVKTAADKRRVFSRTDLGYRDEVVGLAAALSSFLDEHADELSKVAADLPPARETLDMVLSLNFLNPDNLRVLHGYLPTLEKCASRLAELLVATRMGLSGDPEPVRLAMQYVNRAATQLRYAVTEE